MIVSRDYITVVVLFLINLLNYTIAAVLTDVQPYFGISDVMVGLLQTVFIGAYMVFAPVCGYLGDRFSRKIIMVTGIIFWSTTVFFSSFVPKNFSLKHFWLFLMLRGLVGVGEASYSTIAPVVIADLYTNERRTKMLMFFYFAVPIGSGLGYVVGAHLADLFGGWQWGIRLTPLLGIGCLFLLTFVVKEPTRGAAEKASQFQTSSWRKDLKYLFSKINFIFGMITCLSGFVGVSAGSLWAARWRRFNGKADCYVCAIGLIVCTPFYFAAINLVDQRINLFWVFSFCSVTCLCLNWAVLSDLLLKVVVPSRRATANSVQILFGHLFGDASSPYIVGHISEVILAGRDSYVEHFYSLKYALLLPPFALLLGGWFFLWCSLHVEKDKEQVKLAIVSSVDEPENDLGSLITGNHEHSGRRQAHSDAVDLFT